MKMLSISLLTVSLSAFAANPELEEIFKKHESTLMNFKVGMKSVSNIERTDFVLAEDGTMSTSLTREYATSVLLKVDGTKVYEFEVTRDLATGKEYTMVHLNDYKYAPSSESEVSNIKVVNDVLSFDLKGNSDDEYSSFSFEGSYAKELKSSLFCDSTQKVAGIYTNLPTGNVYNFKHNETNKCNGIMPTSEIKKIVLTEVVFCDHTLPEYSEYSCETRDMSFLTIDL